MPYVSKKRMQEIESFEASNLAGRVPRIVTHDYILNKLNTVVHSDLSQLAMLYELESLIEDITIAHMRGSP